jgi:hypothetical protein
MTWTSLTILENKSTFIHFEILKIDKNDFKGTTRPIEAKNLIYINTLGLDKNLLHGLNISFNGHPVITYCLREQIKSLTQPLRVKILFLIETLAVKGYS